MSAQLRAVGAACCVVKGPLTMWPRPFMVSGKTPCSLYPPGPVDLAQLLGTLSTSVLVPGYISSRRGSAQRLAQLTQQGHTT